jgi:hypothetical protein
MMEYWNTKITKIWNELKFEIELTISPKHGFCLTNNSF